MSFWDDHIAPVMTGASAGTAGRKGMVPAPAAGDQDKQLHGDATWRASTSASAASRLEASQSALTTKWLNPDNALFAGSPLFNLRAPRGGIYFDGSANTRCWATLTGQAFATDPVSWHIVTEVPATVSAGYGWCSLSSDNTTGNIARAFRLTWQPGLLLGVTLFGATTSDANLGDFDLSAWAGQAVDLTIVRPASGTPLVYCNGVSITGSFSTLGTPPGWQGSITSTYWNIGFNSTAGVLTGPIRSAALYNLELSASDAAELHFRGGAVPFRYQFGSQAELITNTDFATDTVWTKDAGWTIAAGVASAATAGNAQIYQTNPFAAESGKAYRTKFTVTAYTSGGFRASISRTGVATGTTRAAAGTYVEVLTMPSGLSGTTYASIDAVGASTGSVDNVSFTRAGAVVDLECDGGFGLRLRDRSTNQLDAEMTTTGVAHLITKAWSVTGYNLQTGTSYTLAALDCGKVVSMNNASANTLTVPANSSVAFPTGTVIPVRQRGAGQTTIAAAGGVTINSRGAALKLAGQHARAVLEKIGTDEWDLTGDVTT